MTIRGIDVSSWQPVIDWPQVAASGIAFAFVKATGGAHYRNPRYRDQVDGARAVGLVVGHYHYAHELSFNPPPRTPEEEAEYFLAHIDARPGELLALDIEDPAVHGNLAEWALRWLVRVEEVLGCAPFLYTYPYYAIERSLTAPALGRYPLWWASYDTPPHVPPSVWRKWTILQQTASAFIPGIGPNVDENRFEGSAIQLREWGVPQQQQQPADAAAVRQYLNDLGNLIVEINFGGELTNILGVNYADIGGSAVGTDGATYDRSLQGGKWLPWVRRE